MKKLILFALAAGMLTFGSIDASAQRARTQQRTSQSSSTKLSPEAFVRKWQSRLELLQQGIVEYGTPKQFFTQMQQSLPDNFRMKFVTNQGGIQYYAFALIPADGSNILSGSLGFQGGKVYGSEINSWGYDEEYIMQLKQQLDWR